MFSMAGLLVLFLMKNVQLVIENTQDPFNCAVDRRFFFSKTVGQILSIDG